MTTKYLSAFFQEISGPGLAFLLLQLEPGQRQPKVRIGVEEKAVVRKHIIEVPNEQGGKRKVRIEAGEQTETHTHRGRLKTR